MPAVMTHTECPLSPNVPTHTRSCPLWPVTGSAHPAGVVLVCTLIHFWSIFVYLPTYWRSASLVACDASRPIEMRELALARSTLESAAAAALLAQAVSCICVLEPRRHPWHLAIAGHVAHQPCAPPGSCMVVLSSFYEYVNLIQQHRHTT